MLTLYGSDAHDLPIEELKDGERLYPGAGVIDLSGFPNNLKAIGYNHVVAQEVLAPVSELDVESRFSKWKAGFERCLNQNK